MTDPLKIDDLYLDAVDVLPVPFEWHNRPWDQPHPPEHHHEKGDSCAECYGLESWSEELDAPVMHYYYPLPNFVDGPLSPANGQAALWAAPVNVTMIWDSVEDVWALALTGGGMDYSWDICHAYILMGYAPPLHFCDLPDFAGQDVANEPFWSVVKACLISLETAETRIGQRRKGLLNLMQSSLTEDRKTKAIFNHSEMYRVHRSGGKLENRDVKPPVAHTITKGV